MSANRNEYRFGILPMILSILILGLLIGYWVHASVPEKHPDADAQHECTCPGEDGDME